MSSDKIKPAGTYPVAYGRSGSKVWLTLWQREVEINGRHSSYAIVSRGDSIDDDSRHKKPDAVVVVAFYAPKDGERRLLVTSEYRIPIGCRELGFVAGLIDADDFVVDGNPVDYTTAARNAACREMLEETNGKYRLLPTEVSPNNLWSSPGMTDESIVYVFGFIEEADGEDAAVRMEGNEDIEAKLWNRDELITAMETPESERDYTFGKTSWPFLWAFKHHGFDFYKGSES